MPTTIGQILVNSVLPERFRDYNRALGADELEDLLKRIINEDPDSYREVSAKLMRLGARAAYDTGTTLKLSDLEAPFDNTEMYRRLDQVEDAIQNDKTLTPAQKREKLADIYDQVYTETKKKAYTVADSKGNGFAMQVKSKARGNQDQLSAMINTPGTYKDPKGNTVPMFIRHSYAEGLNPAEYWAGSYGARTGVTCLALDTEVLMGDWSVKKIIDIKPGDTVMGSNANGQMYPVSVLRVYDNGVQPVYRFSFRVGSSRNNFIHVDATEEHKMLARICNFGGSRRDGTRKPYSMSDPSLVKLAEAIPNQKRLEYSKYVAQMALDAYNPTLKQARGVIGMRSKDIGCRIAKKEFLGNLPVMDIEVDSQDHMFVLANGLISSNSTKFATANAGALGKLFSSASIEQVVTEDDCNTIAGLPVKTDDKDNIGCVLASDIGGYKAGTVITKSVVSDLQKQKVEDILVRSPITCGAKNGVCSHCAGIRENGKFPEIGYNLGLNAASALAERVAQGSLNTKHSGKKLEGVHGSYSGFDMLKSMATVPKVYKDKATVSEIDGTVEKIEKAPQGGSYVWVNDQKFYVPHGYDILVKQGDTVEAGDQLSDGVINPADAVRLKGIGEGRRYFTQRFTKAYRDSGYKGSRRNVEALSKSLIDNVVVDDTDAEGQMLPGDLVSYSRWSWGYKPRPNSVQDAPNKALGKYLEQPALHYSIGTRVTKKVIDELNKFKVPTVLYNENPPGVHPDMRSIVETTGQTDDWMGRLGTTYIGKRLIEDVQQGAESNSKGLNPYPAVAKGTTLGQWGTPGHQNEEFHY